MKRMVKSMCRSSEAHFVILTGMTFSNNVEVLSIVLRLNISSICIRDVGTESLPLPMWLQLASWKLCNPQGNTNPPFDMNPRLQISFDGPGVFKEPTFVGREKRDRQAGDSSFPAEGVSAAADVSPLRWTCVPRPGRCTLFVAGKKRSSYGRPSPCFPRNYCTCTYITPCWPGQTVMCSFSHAASFHPLLGPDYWTWPWHYRSTPLHSVMIVFPPSGRREPLPL